MSSNKNILFSFQVKISKNYHTFITIWQGLEENASESWSDRMGPPRLVIPDMDDIHLYECKHLILKTVSHNMG